MKANELRIGNYVCVTEKHPLKVKIINDSDGIMSTVSDNSIFITTASLLAYKPIPLTEEWLLKFGFKKNIEDEWDESLTVDVDNPVFLYNWTYNISDVFSFYSDFCYSETKTELCFEFESTGVNIKYIHQLQNIYHALTGEELTIKQNDEK
jgi:hypothetical protein